MAELNSRRSSSRRSNPVRSSVTRRLRRSKKSPSDEFLPRSASEPEIWTVRFKSDDQHEPSLLKVDPTFYCITTTLQSCSDIFSSPPPLPDPLQDEKKVVLSVTVEGSVGPIKAMVKLGTSVEEAIKLIVEKYRGEGRRPILDISATDCLQLHHSHFSLQSINKREKIGEVGGRSFYLRKSSESSRFDFCKQENCSNLGTGRGRSEISLYNSNIQVITPSELLISFLFRNFKKIGRRARRILRVVTCINCAS